MPSHETYLRWCEASAHIFAKCSRRQYFAVVVAPSGRVLGTGYNGAPSGLLDCTDGGCPRASSNVAHGAPYDTCVALHAEENAIVHSDRSAREGGTLYVNGPPCWQCSKLIAGSGIKTLVHTSDLAYKDWPKCQALLAAVGVETIAIDTSDRDEPRDLGSPVGLGETGPLALADRTTYGTLMAWGNHPGPLMGTTSIERFNDSSYD